MQQNDSTTRKRRGDYGTFLTLLVLPLAVLSLSAVATILPHSAEASPCGAGVARFVQGNAIGLDAECLGDEDCDPGRVCNLWTGICIDPDGACLADADCGGGQVCNRTTAICIDPNGPCVDDGDCGCEQLCNTSIGVCMLRNGACTSDEDCVGGQLCDTDSGVCADPTNECLGDADCDDSLYCNGTETCHRIHGCKAGDSPCYDGIACTIDGCDEDTDTCSYDPSDAACDDGLYCTGVETCNAETGCVAGEALDCSAEDGVCSLGSCDEASQGCVLVPQNEGGTCQAHLPEHCVLSATCGLGDCIVIPLCSEQCERCDPDGCASLCGNPFNQADDTVNTTDALFNLRVAVDLEQCNLCVCDVTGDGVVTATDALALLRKAVKLPVEFDCHLPGEPTTTTSTTSTTTTSATTTSTSTTSTSSTTTTTLPVLP